MHGFCHAFVIVWLTVSEETYNTTDSAVHYLSSRLMNKRIHRNTQYL